eukprot:2463185-Amphidinium_carterae.1
MFEGKFAVPRHYIGKLQVRLRAVVSKLLRPCSLKLTKLILVSAGGEETCGEPREEVEFVDFIGVMARGMPASLVLHACDPQHCTTIKAANGRARPPPLSREE